MIDERFLKYAKDVIDGTVVANKWLKLVCQQYLNDILNEDTPYYFDEYEVKKAVLFLENLTLFKEQFARQKLVLMPWQLFLVCALYGVKRKDTKKRKYRQCLLFIGRKNAKSMTSAALSLYGLVNAGQNAEYLLAANSSKQAGIALGFVKNFAKSIDPKNKYFKYYRDSIIFKPTGSQLFVVSSDSTQMDGFSPNGYLCDEVHGFRDDKVVSTLKNGQGAVSEPLGFIASTAGYGKWYLYDLLNTSKEILTGVKTDDSFLPIIYTLDDEDIESGAWKTNENNCWLKANPSLGVTVSEDFLKSQVVEALNNPMVEVSTLVKNFNVYSDVSVSWIPSSYVLNCCKKLNIDDWKEKGVTLYLGLDLASVCDLTALSAMWEYDGKYYFKNWYFLPQETVKNSPNSPQYQQYVRNGELIMTQGNVCDYDYVKNLILKLNKDFTIASIGYDQWQSTQLVIDLTEQGLPLEPFSQSAGSMNRPTKTLERMILNGNAVIDSNSVTTWCFANAVPKYDWNDNCKIVKESNNDKIDGVYAILDALGNYLQINNYFDTFII